MTDTPLSFAQSLANLLKGLRAPKPNHWLDMLRALPHEACPSDPHDDNAALWYVLTSMYSDDPAWCDVASLLHDRCPAPMDSSVALNLITDTFSHGRVFPNTALVTQLWHLFSPLLTDADGIALQPVLTYALAQKEASLASLVLAHGRVSPDVSASDTRSHPFTTVRTDADFQSLIDYGFDPFQTNAEGVTGDALLRQRGLSYNTEHHPGYLNEIEQRAILSRLNDLTQRSTNDPLVWLTRAIDGGRHWTQLRDVLKRIEPSVLWDVRFPGQQTLLHRLAQDRPEWLAPFFRWKPLGQAPLTFFSAEDEHGLQAFWYRFEPPTRVTQLSNYTTWLNEHAGTRWMKTMVETPFFSRWLTATAAATSLPDGPFDQGLQLLQRRGSSYPFETLLSQHFFWMLSDAVGGPSPSEWLARLEARTDWQAIFDQESSVQGHLGILRLYRAALRNTAAYGGSRSSWLTERSDQEASTPPTSPPHSSIQGLPSSSWLSDCLALGLMYEGIPSRRHEDELKADLKALNDCHTLDWSWLNQRLCAKFSSGELSLWHQMRVDFERRQLQDNVTIPRATPTLPKPRL